MVNIEKSIAELNRMFALLNEKYFNNELETPVITIESNGKSPSLIGYFTSEKSWVDKTNNSYYQITICSEYLDRSIEEICATLLHEMVHQYCKMKEIKDTSRSGTYHNKRYMAMAQAHGLEVSFDKKIGWSVSELTKESKSFVRHFARGEFFSLSKTLPKKEKTPDGSDKPKKSSSRKYMCPQCKASVRATREVNIICEDCMMKMERVQHRIPKS